MRKIKFFFRKNKYLVLTILALVFLNLWLYFFIAQGSEPGNLKVYFLDVGQGDSTFIETPQGRQILIDGGPSKIVVQKLSEIMPSWDRSIDLIILTHPELDHIAGLIEVLKRYKVFGIVDSGIKCLTPFCLEWKKLKSKENAILIKPFLGENIILDKYTKLVFLHPFSDLQNQEFPKKNDSSIVAKLIFSNPDYPGNKKTFLFTGDIEKNIEQKLIMAGLDLDSDFLKIPHHGSKTSSTEDFLKKVSPQSAFIMVGLKNRYGHPNESVLKRLENYGIKYYRTDIDGRILVKCNLSLLCQIKN